MEWIALRSFFKFQSYFVYFEEPVLCVCQTNSPELHSELKLSVSLLQTLFCLSDGYKGMSGRSSQINSARTVVDYGTHHHNQLFS